MIEKNIRVVIFTDLDGTLLDTDYSFDDAIPALNMIRKKSVPLIICSSKTRAEVEHYRIRLDNDAPFITENGAGIFVPHDYFGPEPWPALSSAQTGNGPCCRLVDEAGYHVIKLGADYPKLRRALKTLRSEGFQVRGFGDMTAREISDLTGLDLPEAEMARSREFDEPFLFQGDELSRKALEESIHRQGFNLTQGEILHITGQNDKGKATGVIMNIFEQCGTRPISIALGDSPNDLEMLRHVTYPVQVQKKDGSYDERIQVDGLIKAGGIGPKGWSKAVISLLEALTA